jgi:threonine/homoserine/homoserine lactone efflux protein
MPAIHTLLVFTAAVLGLMITPGPNMAFVLAQSVAHGPRGALAVAGGIFAADLGLTVLTVLGVAALMAAWPACFDLLRWAGAAYLAWLALRTWQRRRSAAAESTGTGRLLRDVWFRAFLVSLLNPKALLFFLVFLPPFVEPSRGAVAAQLSRLGLTLSIVAFVFHTLLGLGASRLGRWAGRDAAAARPRRVLQSAIFLGLALRLVVLEAPGPS